MLYKNKYLICLIDAVTQNLVTVYDNAMQFSEAFKVDGRSILSKAFSDNSRVFKKRYIIEFIDCYEKHNDIFKEEDETFIKFIEKEHLPTSKKICNANNISERTYFRWKHDNPSFKEKLVEKYNLLNIDG